ncbi:hypothetical protein L6164_036933 [Bauhinia variegata]|uniref:Uncharacterized protein n=1 Tax=Bauhinia variegata TaxID=167791 RepID=A0ACB9KII8_BAUVA|nr:hypothetical protein L6164_036933 [Bauhinia variegata]
MIRNVPFVAKRKPYCIAFVTVQTKDRNVFRFQKTLPNIQHDVHRAISLAREFSVFSNTCSNPLFNTTRFFGWNKPPKEFYKDNCDASAIANPGSTSFGGVIRDDQGIWIAGFSGKLGNTLVSLGELRSLFHGLKLARHLNI